MQTNSTTRYIRSFTNPNRFYVVALNPRGFYECDCPAAQFNRRSPCKHVKAVAKEGAGLVAKPKAPAGFHRTSAGDVLMEGLNLPDEGMPRPPLRHRPLTAAGQAFASALEV